MFICNPVFSVSVKFVKKDKPFLRPCCPLDKKLFPSAMFEAVVQTIFFHSSHLGVTRIFYRCSNSWAFLIFHLRSVVCCELQPFVNLNVVCVFTRSLLSLALILFHVNVIRRLRQTQYSKGIQMYYSVHTRRFRITYLYLKSVPVAAFQLWTWRSHFEDFTHYSEKSCLKLEPN